MQDAINDCRIRPTHRAMDGHIAPIDDPIWKKWSLPAVEPDAGWERDPTEGNNDLVQIIRARQASCLTTFAANEARARGLWCDDGPPKKALDTMLPALFERALMPKADSLRPDEILAFAALAMTVSDRLLIAKIGPVANAILVQDSTGFDLSGFTHAIDNYGIRHAMKQHGSVAREQARGQVAVVFDDFGLIPSITLEPDSVFHDGKNRIGRDVIVFTKIISGVGYWYAAEIRAGKRVVATDSLRKKEGPWKAP